MSKDKTKQTTPGEYPIREFRTEDQTEALNTISNLFHYKKQFTVAYMGDEIIINYTSGPSHG